MGLAGLTSGRVGAVKEPIVSFVFLRTESPRDAARNGLRGDYRAA